MKKERNKFILLSGLVTTTMFLLNKLWTTLATRKDVLSTPQDEEYEWRFGTIRYRKQGSGTPVLCIHGLTPGSSLYEFHELSDKLATKYEVYSLDLLGYGLSEKPNLTYTNYMYMELVIDFIKNVIKKKTNIITSNESASIAIMVCNQEADLVGKCILCNPANLFEMNEIPSAQTKLLKKIIDLPILGTFIYHIYMSEAMIQKNFVENYFYNPNRIKQNDIAAYLQSSHTDHSHGKYTYASYQGRYMNTNIIHSLKAIDHSIMILASKELENAGTDVDNYLYYNASIEKVYLSRVKKLMTLESPSKVMHYVETFLA